MILFQVARFFGRDVKTITNLLSKFRRTGSVNDLPRRPRARVTTPRQDRVIRRSHVANRFLSATETARNTLGAHNRQISADTVRRRLKEVGLRARRPYRGVILTPRHRRARLVWARRHLRLTGADWGKVLFTDESRFCLQGNDGRRRCYRRRGERFNAVNVVQRDQFRGGSVMIWGGISLHTRTRVVVVNGRLNAQRYQNTILTPVAIPHVQQNRRMTFMHDGAPCHTAAGTQRLLNRNQIRVLPWCSKSPDMNPIEHLWDELDRRLRRLQNQPQTVQQLQQALVQLWNTIPHAFIANLVMSMRRRCRALIRANGGHTRY